MLQNITILFVKIIPFLVQQNVGLVQSALHPDPALALAQRDAIEPTP